jgi:hypothetical protein
MFVLRHGTAPNRTCGPSALETRRAAFLIEFAVAIGLAVLVGWWLFWRSGMRLDMSRPTVELAMPASDIFSTRIDNNRTRVYSRETGLFTSPDPNLESEVRREAERQVRQAALDGGILAAASSNARTTLTTFLKGLGFEAVRFR